MHAEQHVGIERDIFGGGVPFRRKIGEIGKGFAVVAGQLAIDQRALARIARGFDSIW
jgi:hypothetical protein